MSTLTPFVLRGDSRRQSLDTLQDRIATLKVEHSQALHAARPAQEVKAALLAALVPGASSLRSRATDLCCREKNTGLYPAEPLTLADLAWIFGAELIAERVCAAACSDPGVVVMPAALSRNDRESKLEKASADLFALEVQEERMVLELTAAGVPAIRREGANPQAILSVWQGA